MNFSQQFIQFTSFSALLCYHAYSVGGYTLSCYTKTLLGSRLYVDIVRVKSQSRRYAPLHIGNELCKLRLFRNYRYIRIRNVCVFPVKQFFECFLRYLMEYAVFSLNIR